MVMDTIQIRMNKELLVLIDSFVKKGIYSNRSDVIRDAVRRFVWNKEVGTINLSGNSVEDIREIRKKLSSTFTEKDIKKINKL